MPTPSIQTLRADAQQVLNLDSISAVRSVVAATLANANAGTPLNPNLTTQQLWNEFYQIVTQPKSDIESIIANQLMKFLYAPPAPGGAGADKQVIFNDGGVLAGDPQFLWNKTTNLLTVTGSATITGDLTVDTSTLKVDAANNRVGIGTATPSASLDVNGASNLNGNVTIANTGSPFGTLFVTGSALELQANSNATNGLSLKTTSATPIIFSVNGSEAMRLNSNGLGVGTSPSYKLEVVAPAGDNIVSTFRSGDATAANNAGGGFRSISSATAASRVAQVWLDADGANFSGGDYFFIQKNGGSGTVEFNQSSNAAMVFLTNSTERMRIDSSGNVGIGVTPSAGKGCLQLSSGINFPATQVASSDANTLDDYEEGNWTPSITFGGASVGMTGTFAGRYTKVGRAVTINGIIALTAKGSSTGIAKIAGLPFTSANASGEYTAISIRLDRVSFADYPCGYVGPNSSVVELENTTNAGTISSMTDSNFINTSVVIVNFTYTV